VPVVGLALIAAWRGMPDTPSRGDRPLDVTGLLLLSPALAGIVFGFSRAGSHGGFGAPDVVISLALGLGLLAGFVRHALTTRVEPLIDLRLFRVRSFAASSALMFLIGAALFGAMLLLPLYYQQARGQSALDAGLLLAPQGLGLGLALLLVSRLAQRTSPRAAVLGGVVLTLIGTAAYTQVTPHTSVLLLGASLVIRGAGIGAVFVPVMAASYIGLRHDQIPRATTAVRIFQQVGGSLGTAVFAVILQRQSAHPAAAGQSGNDVVAAAFGTTFWWALGLTAIALVPALLLPGRTSSSEGS
jgi:predicted MFS family arabinose efflux permease